MKTPRLRPTVVESLEARTLLTVNLGEVDGQLTIPAPKGGSQVYEFHVRQGIQGYQVYAGAQANGPDSIIRSDGAVMGSSKTGGIPFELIDGSEYFLHVSGDTKPILLTTELTGRTGRIDDAAANLGTTQLNGWVGNSYPTNYWIINADETSQVTVSLKSATVNSTRIALYYSSTPTTGSSFSKIVNPGMWYLEVAQSSLGKSTNYDVQVTITNYPILTSVAPPASGTYRLGSELSFSAKFASPVTPPGLLQFTAGGKTFTAAPSAPEFDGPAQQILYYYTVQPGDNFTGISSIGPNIDSPGQSSVTQVSASGVVVDGTQAHIVSVTPPDNATYHAGQTLSYVVHFDEPVTVNSGCALGLNVGFATYAAGSGTTSVTFVYTVPENQAPMTVAFASPTTLDAYAVGPNQNIANVNFTGFSTPGIRIDGTTANVVSVEAPTGSIYTGQQAVFTVNFSLPVYVTGNPTLQYGQYTATYSGGSGTTALTFAYAVIPGVGTGFSSAIPTIALAGGSIATAVGSAADLSITPSNGVNAGVTIYGVGPALTQIAAPPEGPCFVGQTIYFTAYFSDLELQGDSSLYVTGSPELQIAVGSQTQYATFLRCDGQAKAIEFQYTPQPADAGSVISWGKIVLNGGTIADGDGVNANLQLSVSPYVVTVQAPPTTAYVQSVSTLQQPVQSGDTVTLQVLFSDAVTVSGPTTLQIYNPSQFISSFANYVSGSGTNTLTFSLTIQPAKTSYVAFAFLGVVDSGGSIIDVATGDVANGTLYTNVPVFEVVTS